MKKLLSLFILSAVLLPAQALASFSDVDDSTDYSEAIEWMEADEIVEGYGDGTFLPDKCVSRAEFLKMLYLSQELSSMMVASGSYFNDVAEDDWFYSYVALAHDQGLVQGYADGSFRPHNCVSRVEAIKMATIQYDFYDDEAIGQEGDVFGDVEEGSWYEPYFYSAYHMNMVGLAHVSFDASGSSYVRSFYPNGAMSRAEVAELLYRMEAVRDHGLSHYSEGISPGLMAMMESDVFADHGLTFSYPSSLFLSEQYSEDVYILDTQGRSFLEGDGGFFFTTIWLKEGSMEDELANLAEWYLEYEEQSYVVNGNDFVRVSYYSEFGDYEAVVFYLDLGDAYFMLSPATDAGIHEQPAITGMAQLILESVVLDYVVVD